MKIVAANRILNAGRWAMLAATLALTAILPAGAAQLFQAGAAAVDITPEKLPVIINGGFLEGRASQVNDRLHTRSLVLDDGSVRLALTVVDSCMLPRELLDTAKELASAKTGIPTERMLISATHTHSAPAAMGCLGCPVDVDYIKDLPQRIAAGIEQAARNLTPARIGWIVTNDWEHTHNRRWIFRPDRIGTDPFGQRTVRANMHPGYQNPDAIGPSGPVDPGLSILSIQSLTGQPLAVLANYSMHYFGAAAVSADYYGKFVAKLTQRIVPTPGGRPFVGIMSQGTSGDLMWMDYGLPKSSISLDQYAEGVTQVAFAAYQRIRYHRWVPLAMAETKLSLLRRTPDEGRLAWAKGIIATMTNGVPRNQREVYAKEQVFLHDEPVRELKLQALRIGDLGIAAIPNEVFAITGLKIKAQSPLPTTLNIELANGSEGYIPPPEQHRLGGYTTWPARTAALEVTAEPKIFEAVVQLLEKVSGKKRRPMPTAPGAYAKAVLASKPAAYWRLHEPGGPTVFDATGRGRSATLTNGAAFYLPGPASSGHSAKEQLNRCVHLAGGRLTATLPGIGNDYSVEMWFWNGLPADARKVTGVLFARGVEGEGRGGTDRLGIAGMEQLGRLSYWADGAGSHLTSIGRTPSIPLKTWCYVVLVREGEKLRVYLNGQSEPEVSALADVPFDREAGSQFFFGGSSQPENSFEGRIDEVAVYSRALSAREITRHFQAAQP